MHILSRLCIEEEETDQFIEQANSFRENGDFSEGNIGKWKVVRHFRY